MWNNIFSYRIVNITWSEVKSLSRVCLFVAPWTVAHQAPPSMEFSWPEYWSGLPFPSSGDLPFPGIDPASLASPALVKGSNWKEVKMSRNPVLLRATLPNVVWGEQKSPAPNILSLWHKNYLKLIIFLKSRQKKISENQVEVTFS